MVFDHVISGDPGTKNFGLAVYRRKNKKYECLGSCQLKCTITDLKLENFQKQLKDFDYQFKKMLNLPGKNLLVLERFMTRGNKNSVSESCNIMIGAIVSRSQRKGTSVQLLPASQWKNAFHRKFGKEMLQELYYQVNITPHRIDASLIGAYAIDRFLGFKIDKDWKTRVVREYKV